MDLIICTATFEVRCGWCQRSATAYIEVPVNDHLYFDDPAALDMILESRFAPSVGKTIAAQHGCDSCGGADFEVLEVRRLPAYRAGDEMRLPLKAWS